MRSTLFALLFLAATQLSAQSSTILIPTLYNGPGAFGSRWWSAVIINNHSEAPFTTPGLQFGINCPIPEGCVSDTIPPGQFGGVAGPLAANGLLLHGDPAVLANLAFHGRFGQGTNYLTNGTELPIVRESEFVRGPIHFPYVTLYDTPQAIRATLRIYGPDAVPGTTVRVEVRHWDVPTGSAKASETVPLSVPSSTVSLPLFPAFAQVSLSNDFPFDQLLGDSFNVSVIPLPLPSGETPRIWAFISSTENGSQLVSVQTPQ